LATARTISIAALATFAAAFGIGKVHTNLPAGNVRAVQAANGSLGILAVVELHEGETFGLACLLVFANAYIHHLTDL
jgi:hypothetical protein